MCKRAVCIFAWFVLIGAYGNVFAKGLTKDQSELVNSVVSQYSSDCLNTVDPETIEDAFARQLAKWKQEPALCQCRTKRLKAALTQHVLSGAELDTQQFVFRWTASDQLWCEVPHLTKHYRQSCVPVMTSYFTGSMGESTAAAKSKSLCGCINEALTAVDLKAGIAAALKNFDAQEEALRLGKFLESTPNPELDKMGKCFAAP